MNTKCADRKTGVMRSDANKGQREVTCHDREKKESGGWRDMVKICKLRGKLRSVIYSVPSSITGLKSAGLYYSVTLLVQEANTLN